MCTQAPASMRHSQVLLDLTPERIESLEATRVDDLFQRNARREFRDRGEPLCLDAKRAGRFADDAIAQQYQHRLGSVHRQDRQGAMRCRAALEQVEPAQWVRRLRMALRGCVERDSAFLEPRMHPVAFAIGGTMKIFAGIRPQSRLAARRIDLPGVGTAVHRRHVVGEHAPTRRGEGGRQRGFARTARRHQANGLTLCFQGVGMQTQHALELEVHGHAEGLQVVPGIGAAAPVHLDAIRADQEISLALTVDLQHPAFGMAVQSDPTAVPRALIEVLPHR